MTIEIGHYGFELDTEWCYIALSWELLTAATILAATLYAYKLYKRIKVTK